VEAAAAYLRRRCPGQPLFLVGISYGAAVALQALPRLPDVRGVWSEGCFDRFSHVVDHYFSPVPTRLRSPLLAAYDSLASLDAGFRAADIHPRAALEGVRVPIYFCHARGDALIPLAEALALYDSYRGPKYCYWVEGATHHHARQRCPQEYLRRLRTFLEGLLLRPENSGGRPHSPGRG
jgi:pimeloyl-ACP methyl ester carboxylesterase